LTVPSHFNSVIALTSEAKVKWFHPNKIMQKHRTAILNGDTPSFCIDIHL
jgi:hypothetical protein